MSLETLKTLISSGALEEIKGISLLQIEKRATQATKDLTSAELLLQFRQNNDSDSSIFKLLYDSGRVLVESFLLLKGYKVKIVSDRHKKVFQVGQLMIHDGKIKTILSKLNRIRRTRNKIDYDIDITDISSAGLPTIVRDIKTLLSFVRDEIKQDPRY